MTSKRDLGPILAAAGGVVVLGAIVAGFVVVGGPGDARALRFDDMRLSHMQQMASAAQCAFAFTGAIPPTVEGVRTAIEEEHQPVKSGDCSYFDASRFADPAVDYSVTDAEHIQLCADFRRPTPQDGLHAASGGSWSFPELGTRREKAGRQCYTVKLVRLELAPVEPPASQQTDPPH